MLLKDLQAAMPCTSPLPGPLPDGGREWEDEGRQQDDRRDRTGQGRAETSMPMGAASPNAHRFSCLQPQTSEGPQSPPQERKQRQRRDVVRRDLVRRDF